MKHVIPRVHYAAHRFGIVASAGGRFVGRCSADDRLHRHGAAIAISEFAAPDGTVIARKVVAAGGATECWLRADLADLAEQALHAEAAESARIAADVISYSLGRDEARAADAGMTVEQYRQTRNHTLARIDQRRGRNSVGMG